jgi:hypothetical protein
MKRPIGQSCAGKPHAGLKWWRGRWGPAPPTCPSNQPRISADRVVRAGVFGIWAWILATQRFEQLSCISPTVCAYGSGSWLAFVPRQAVIVLRLILMTMCVIGVRGRLPRSAAVVLTFGVLVLEHAVRSIAFNNHAELVALYALIFACAEDALGSDNGQGGSRDALWSWVVCMLCISYWLTGVRRALSDGLPWMWRGGMRDIIVLSTFEHQGLDLNGGRMIWETDWGWPIVWAGGIGVEVLEFVAPFCMISDRFLRVFMPCAILFHIASALVLDIFFWENCVLAASILIGSRYRGRMS